MRFGWRGRAKERVLRNSIGSMLVSIVFGKRSKCKSEIFKAAAREMG